MREPDARGWVLKVTHPLHILSACVYTRALPPSTPPPQDRRASGIFRTDQAVSSPFLVELEQQVGLACSFCQGLM